MTLKYTLTQEGKSAIQSFVSEFANEGVDPGSYYTLAEVGASGYFSIGIEARIEIDKSHCADGLSHVLKLKKELFIDNKSESGFEEIEVEVSDAPDLIFNGKLIAEVKELEQRGVWREMRLFAVESGGFICHLTNGTRWEGKKNKYSAFECDSEDEVKEYFGFSDLAKELYKKAGIPTNHAGRSMREGDSRHPTAQEVATARTQSGLTQSEAAALVYSGLRSWQQWEAGDRKMHPSAYELFLIKTGLKVV